MATSSRLLLPYPDPSQNPWGSTFVSLINAIDASLYTPREDRNIIMSGGGTMTFTASTGVLTWSAPINLFASVTGFNWSIPTNDVNPGSVTLQDGQLFYITVARAPQNNTSYAPIVGSYTPNQPNGDNQILIGIRIGSVIHFRDGFLISDGESTFVFDNSSQGLPPGMEQGDVLYFNGDSWVILVPGTVGQSLQTRGIGADPVWAGPGNPTNLPPATQDLTMCVQAALGLNIVSGKVDTWQDQSKPGTYFTTSGTGAVLNPMGINGQPTLDFTAGTTSNYFNARFGIYQNSDLYVWPNAWTIGAVVLLRS
jgi:hypothetical protein